MSKFNKVYESILLEIGKGPVRSKQEALSILGLSSDHDLSLDQLGVICKRKAKENHPDRGGSTEKMVMINHACEMLKDIKANPYKDINSSWHSSGPKSYTYKGPSSKRPESKEPPESERPNSKKYTKEIICPTDVFLIVNGQKAKLKSKYSPPGQWAAEHSISLNGGHTTTTHTGGQETTLDNWDTSFEQPGTIPVPDMLKDQNWVFRLTYGESEWRDQTEPAGWRLYNMLRKRNDDGIEVNIDGLGYNWEDTGNSKRILEAGEHVVELTRKGFEPLKMILLIEPKEKDLSRSEKLKQFFTKGNIIYLKYWHSYDKVLDLIVNSNGSFTVTVMKVTPVDPKGKGAANWIESGKIRKHSTDPFGSGDTIVDHVSV